jgi:predicted O-linked N-acetylglucosamine transferase (SPINDLY family)
MRGRHSFGILRQLGVTETIARDKADYVDIAVRLGQDREWRAHVLKRMAEGHERLFSDTSAVRALEKFYRTVVQERLG